jgi:hypothetical protein
MLLAASAASAAVPGVQRSGAQAAARTMQNGNSNHQVTYFSKQGTVKNPPTHAEIWGVAALGANDRLNAGMGGLPASQATIRSSPNCPTG